MRSGRWWIAWTLLAGLALTACGPKAERFAAGAPGSPPPATPTSTAREADSSAPGGAGAPSTTPTPATANRKIVYTAELSLRVKSLDPVITEARKLVAQVGGYVSEEQLEGGDRARTATLTLRVPADRFDPAMAGLSKLGEVLDRHLSTQDVTEQWVDLDARLRNLRREEQRLLAILDKASQVSDLLQIERELTRVRGEIEHGDAELRHLNGQVELATITLRLNLPAEVGASMGGQSWIAGVASGAAALFVNIGKALIGLVIYLLAMAPFVGLFYLLGWLLQRRRRH